MSVDKIITRSHSKTHRLITALLISGGLLGNMAEYRSCCATSGGYSALIVLFIVGFLVSGLFRLFLKLIQRRNGFKSHEHVF